MSLDIATSKHRYVVLDSLRGVCACMVVILHCQTQGFISGLPVVRHASLFVDFFFVLSGFVIGSSYGERLAQGFSIRRFMWLRLGRIYPLHFAVLMAYLAFEIVFALFLHGMANRAPFEGPYSLPALIQSLLLVHIFFGADALYWNGPSWSIAAEIWTYLIFALLLRYAFRILVPLSLAITVAAAIILANLTDRNIAVFHDGALVRCMFGFALGIVGWRYAAWAGSRTLPRWADNAIELAVVIGIIALVWTAEAGRLSLAAPFLFLVAVLIFSRERGIVSALLKRPSFILLGTLSYSIYMIHAFLLARFVNVLSLAEKVTGRDLVYSSGYYNMVGGGAWFGDVITIVFLGLVICCSYLSYRLIELPGQKFTRRFVQRPRMAPLPATPGGTLNSAAKRPM